MAKATPTKQLDQLIARLSPEVAAVTKAALKKMRTLVPGALVLVYDNHYALAIGFGPSEKGSECIFSLAAYRRWVNLFFMQGKALPDPQQMLKGTGNQVRHIRLESADDLDAPAVRHLIDVALERAKVPLDPDEKSRIVIKSFSEK